MKLRLVLIICACVILDWYIKNNMISKSNPKLETSKIKTLSRQ
ncbi:MAG: hypothetical protein WA432_00120 [Candidatus Babeliaceae bacterium]